MAWYEYYIFPLESDKIEILSSLLFEIGVDGAEEEETGLKVYFDESKVSVDTVEKELNAIPFLANCQFEKKEIPDVNWNEEWEKEYEAVYVDRKIKVRASFHPVEADIDYDILIDPKMSFGTAHHATTYMMMQAMLDLDFKGKTVLDFGCGTAILAILAEKMGAERTLAIDFDEWAFENAQENIEKNNCSSVQVKLGDAQNLETNKYDIVLANVNRNAILENAEILRQQMKPSAYLLLSGLLEADEKIVLEKFTELSCTKLKTFKRDNWIAIVLKGE